MKRFYKKVSVQEAVTGFEILLDGKPVKTPMRRALSLPNEKLAEAVQLEWDTQGDKIDAASMVMTGFANAAIDRVADDRDTFIQNIATYAESDLFCYRADTPEPLIDRQMKEWQPWLDWAEKYYDAPLITITGIMHKDQPVKSLSNLKEVVKSMDIFALSSMSKMTHISGSLIACLAIYADKAGVHEIWPALCLDELWQEEQWGADNFAEKHRGDRLADFNAAVDFLKLI